MTDLLSSLRESLAGRYRVDREIGRGGMASVHLAHDVRHDRPVAIKVLHPQLAMAIGAERFHREIQVVARLRHPHIVPLYDSGEAGDLLYYVMPFVKGESLRARLARTGRLPHTDALRLVREIADALDYAHGEGVIHRDIKPDNIMIDDRHAMLTDFGIARAVSTTPGATLTEAGLFVGTPAYMSPEQVTGQHEVDGRSDLYSLGSVLYEMIAGEPAFAGPTAQAVLAKRLGTPQPPLPALGDPSAPVANIITTSLRVDPAERFPDARTMGEALDAAHTASKSPDYHTPPRLPPSATTRGSRIAWVAALAGFAVLVTALVFRSNWSTRGAGAISPAGILSIGVLPFANPRGNAEMEYFSDGVTDELITALSRVEGLQVVGRTSTFALKGTQIDAKEAARRLQVTHVIDGSVRYDSAKVRVTWQLMNGESGLVIGSGEFNGEKRNVMAVQDSLARSVVEKLRDALGTTTAARVAAPRHTTTDFEAYNLYLKGHFYWNQRTPQTMRQGIAYLRAAIERDSMYALAWAELSSALTLQPAFGDARVAEVHAPAREAAARAVALDSTLAEAYTALGISATFNDWDWTAGLRHMDRAVALDPQNPFVHLFRVWPLVALRRLDDALAEIRRARELDPLSAIINARLGMVLIYMRRFDDALAELGKALEIDPSNVLARFQFAKALMHSGRLDSALKVFPDAVDAEAGFATGALGLAYGRAGRQAEARQVLARLEARARVRPILSEGLALAALGVGDSARAVSLIERAAEEHSLYMTFLRYDPVYDWFRAQPRVQEVLRKAGL